MQLSSVVNDLVNHTDGAIPRDRLEQLVDRTYDQMQAEARVQTYLPVLVARKALEQARLELAEATGELAEAPEVLIVCQDNSGRSQAAAALFRHYAPGKVLVVSAGVTPASHVQEEVLNTLAGHGLLLTDRPSHFTPEMVAAADHVIVIGEVNQEFVLNDSQDLHQWTDIPATFEQFEPVLVQIDDRVRSLLGQWYPQLDLPDSVIGYTL